MPLVTIKMTRGIYFIIVVVGIGIIVKRLNRIALQNYLVRKWVCKLKILGIYNDSAYFYNDHQMYF
jgi:hypothetical protein